MSDSHVYILSKTELKEWKYTSAISIKHATDEAIRRGIKHVRIENLNGDEVVSFKVTPPSANKAK